MFPGLFLPIHVTLAEIQQQISDLKKRFPHIMKVMKKLTHNLIDYSLFVGYNIDG
jgi:hypothetical protein